MEPRRSFMCLKEPTVIFMGQCQWQCNETSCALVYLQLICQSEVTCGNRLALGDHAVVFLATRTLALEFTIPVYALRLSTDIAQQRTLIHICGKVKECINRRFVHI